MPTAWRLPVDWSPRGFPDPPAPSAVTENQGRVDMTCDQNHFQYFEYFLQPWTSKLLVEIELEKKPAQRTFFFSEIQLEIIVIETLNKNQ